MIEDDNRYDDFNEDDEEDFLFSDLELWYDDNLRYFVRKATPFVEMSREIPLEIESFYYHVYLPVMQETKPQIIELIHQQYPRTADELRPRFLQEIDLVANEAGHHLLMTMQAIMVDLQKGENLYELYVDLPKWLTEYGKPKPPPEIDYHFMDKWPIKHEIPEEVVKEIAEETWQEDLVNYHFFEGRKKAYYDIFQSAIIKYYPAFLDFNLESWVIFAQAMFIDFLNYKEEIEHIDTLIDYGFDEDDFDLNYTHFSAMLDERVRSRLDKEYKERQDRDKGEAEC